jgi:hypothetical protein
MWRFVIRRYRFARISDLSRRILRDLDGQDLRVPVRLSELIRSFRSRSDGREREAGIHRLELGFRRGFASEAALV